MKKFAFLSLLAILVVWGCNLSAGVEAQPTATLAAVIAEPTVTPTSPAEPTASPTPAPTETPTAQPPSPAWIAYIGADGNLWLGELTSGEKKQLTQDARPWQGSQPGENVIEYTNPKWSSDGKWLAYEREVSIPAESGYDIRSGLWVYDLTGIPRQLAEETYLLGFAWKPGSTLIAYGRSIDPNYFLNKATYAYGIWAVDAISGESYELVPPENGRALVSPQWSPDGRYLAFDEVLYMEGRGNFAYYDFAALGYVGWERAIGSYSWQPGGEQIAYDTMTYTARGDERIYLNNLQGDTEAPFGPDYEPGYAFRPIFSPLGDQLAYLASLEGPDSTTFTLFVMQVSGSEPRDLGTFEQSWDFTWSPDGLYLCFAAGPYDQQQVIILSVADGASQVLDRGNQPAWQPTQP